VIARALALAAALAAIPACASDVVIGDRCGVTNTDRCDGAGVDLAGDAEMVPCGYEGEACCPGVNGGSCKQAALACAAMVCVCNDDLGACGRDR
jgi:hypothetical protein